MEREMSIEIDFERIIQRLHEKTTAVPREKLMESLIETWNKIQEKEKLKILNEKENQRKADKYFSKSIKEKMIFTDSGEYGKNDKIINIL